MENHHPGIFALLAMADTYPEFMLSTAPLFDEDSETEGAVGYAAGPGKTAAGRKPGVRAAQDRSGGGRFSSEGSEW